MKYVVFAIIAFVLYNLFNVLRRSAQGAKHWNESERMFTALRAKGYDKETALLEISKLRHPELSESIHQRIVDKFSDLDSLEAFIYNALDFEPSHSPVYGRTLTHEQALALLESTTVSSNGLVNAHFAAGRRTAD